MGVGAHAPLPLRGEGRDLGAQAARAVEKLFGSVASHPALERRDMAGLSHVVDGHLVGPPGVLDGTSVNFLRTGPALGAAQDDHGPDGSDRRPAGAGLALDALDLVDDLVEGRGHELVHRLRVIALDEARGPAVAAEEALELLPGDAGQHRRVGDLVTVEMEDRQNGPIRGRIEELVAVPAGREGPGLGLAVADDAADQEIRVVEGRAEGVGQRVAELAALVDRARRFGRDVTGDAAGERELPEQAA